MSQVQVQVQVPVLQFQVPVPVQVPSTTTLSPPLAAPLCVTVCAFARTVTIDTHLSHTEERATFRVTVDGRVANCVHGERFASTVSATVISIEYLLVFIKQHVTNVHANHDLKSVA